MDKGKHLHTAGGNINQCSRYGKQYRDFLKQTKKPVLPYDPTLPLPDGYPKGLNTESQKDTCPPCLESHCSQQSKFGFR